MRLKLALFVLFTALFFCVFDIGAFATTEDDKRAEELREKIEELEEKIDNLRDEESSLQKEINSLDSQVTLTEYKVQNAIYAIAATTKEIEELAQDIVSLEDRIIKLENSIDVQEEVLGKRKRIYYKVEESTPPDVELLLFLISPDDLNTKLKKNTYSRILQERDSKLISEMKVTKNAYNRQRELFEEAKKKEESLKQRLEQEKANLETYKAELDKRKIEKEHLLSETQNNEVKYQELLRRARAELDAIENIVRTITFEDGDWVEKGDPIALMGNTGAPDCSTGAHLHFEVRKNGVVVNAENYLKPKSLYVSDYSSGTKTIGTGDWDWPMKNMQITQRFGQTPWSWWYAGGVHAGIDMVSTDITIRAPAEGILVQGNMGCGGSVIKYAAIDHGDGLISYYLHVQ